MYLPSQHEKVETTAGHQLALMDIFFDTRGGGGDYATAGLDAAMMTDIKYKLQHCPHKMPFIAEVPPEFVFVGRVCSTLRSCAETVQLEVSAVAMWAEYARQALLDLKRTGHFDLACDLALMLPRSPSQTEAVEKMLDKFIQHSLLGPIAQLIPQLQEIPELTGIMQRATETLESGQLLSQHELRSVLQQIGMLRECAANPTVRLVLERLHAALERTGATAVAADVTGPHLGSLNVVPSAKLQGDLQPRTGDMAEFARALAPKGNGLLIFVVWVLAKFQQRPVFACLVLGCIWFATVVIPSILVQYAYHIWILK